MALSLALKTAVKHIKSFEEETLRTKVRSRTQCGSVRGSLNLSTQIQVLYVNPVWGGKGLSPKNNFTMINSYTISNLNFLAY